jgi:hypothetical protein
MANAANRSNERTKSAGKCGQIPFRITGSSDNLNDDRNHLISNNYFLNSIFLKLSVADQPCRQLNAQGRNLAESEAFLIFAEPGSRSSAAIGLYIYGYRVSTTGQCKRSSIEPNTLPRH